MRQQLERVATVALAGLFCWAAVVVQSHHLEIHAYHSPATNTGVVLWDCGPGLEVWPLPIYQQDGTLVIYPPWFMEHECS